MSLSTLMAGDRAGAIAPKPLHRTACDPVPARAHRFTVAASVVLVSLASWSAARAQAWFQLTAAASASAADTRGVVDNPPLKNTGVQAITVLPGQGAIGQSAQASADYAGATSASSSSFLLPAPGAFDGATMHASVNSSTGAPGGNEFSQSASASSRTVALYDDVLTPGGVSSGTLVTFRVILTINRSAAVIGTGASASLLLTFGDPGDSLSAIAISDNGNPGTLAVADSFVLQLPAGTPHPIEWRLVGQSSGGAGASPNGPGKANYALVDVNSFPFVTKLYIDPVTPGSSYALASGADLRSTAQVSAVGPDPGHVTLALAAAAPNPAHGAVAFVLTIPSGGAHGDVTVFDVTGHALWQSAARAWSAGTQTVTWPGTTARGSAAAPGVYLVRVATDRGTVAQRVIRLR